MLVQSWCSWIFLWYLRMPLQQKQRCLLCPQVAELEASLANVNKKLDNINGKSA